MNKSWTVAGEPMTVGRYPLKNVIPIARDGAVIAHVNCAFGETAARQEARLIVAAPDLYDVAYELIHGDGTADSIQRCIDMARAALAKVRS